MSVCKLENFWWKFRTKHQTDVRVSAKGKCCKFKWVIFRSSSILNCVKSFSFLMRTILWMSRKKKEFDSNKYRNKCINKITVNLPFTILTQSDKQTTQKGNAANDNWNRKDWTIQIRTPFVGICAVYVCNWIGALCVLYCNKVNVVRVRWRREKSMVFFWEIFCSQPTKTRLKQNYT